MNVQINQNTNHLLTQKSSQGEMNKSNEAASSALAENRSSVQSVQTDEQERIQPTLANLQKQVDGMNKLLEGNHTSIKFNVHKQLERIFVQLIDRETDEVVRELPPEKFLDMMASMLEFAGLLIDKRV